MLGDYSAHNIWAITPQNVMDANEAVTTLMQEKLASTDIEVIPVLGNHDIYPPTLQDFSKGPYYHPELTQLHDLWEHPHWLDEVEANQFSQYGFYSKQLKHDSRGKVIVTNNNACYNVNMLTAQSYGDPAGQLEWLRSEL